jgi:23S rRNA (pseudouridine1915-N3)-methyltransferase
LSLKFTFLNIGRPKFAFVEEGTAHYLKNIRHLAEAELVELKDQGSLRDKESAAVLEAIKKRKLDGGGARVLLLDERGKARSSPEFAKQIGDWRDGGVQRICFVVGGAYGFTEEMRAEYELFSLSKLTFPHDLARILVMEQVYRALHILSGGKYHHEG